MIPGDLIYENNPTSEPLVVTHQRSQVVVDALCSAKWSFLGPYHIGPGDFTITIRDSNDANVRDTGEFSEQCFKLCG